MLWKEEKPYTAHTSSSQGMATAGLLEARGNTNACPWREILSRASGENLGQCDSSLLPFPSRSLHQFSESPTLSRGTSFNSCYSTTGVPQRYVTSVQLILLNNWLCEIIDVSVRDTGWMSGWEGEQRISKSGFQEHIKISIETEKQVKRKYPMND